VGETKKKRRKETGGEASVGQIIDGLVMNLASVIVLQLVLASGGILDDVWADLSARRG
jgi:hypothetical protein